MKWMLTSLAAASLFAMLAFAQSPQYKLTDLGPVGAPPGEPYYIANTGVAAGAAQTTDGSMHAVVWYKGQTFDIGANRLGRPNSQAFGVNERGQVVGEAQTSVSNTEDFCGFNFFGLPSSATACGAFLWQNRMITQLTNPLGGPNAVANMVNNRGEVAGFAETNQNEGGGCTVNQFKPVIWRNGAIEELPTYGGDPDGGVFGINDNGQAVGASGSCAPFNPNSQLYLFEAHAVLWENGTPTNLGGFGGTGAFAGNHACAINYRGQVVGHSDVTGDTTAYGFLWTKETGMQALPPLPGDFASFAININDRGEVVGASLNAEFMIRAFVWRNGVMYDLNTLVPSNSPLYLQTANSINAIGEIVGFGQTADGEVHGFLLTPSGERAPDEQSIARPVVASERARKLVFRRLGIRPR